MSDQRNEGPKAQLRLVRLGPKSVEQDGRAPDASTSQDPTPPRGTTPEELIAMAIKIAHFENRVGAEGQAAASAQVAQLQNISKNLPKKSAFTLKRVPNAPEEPKTQGTVEAFHSTKAPKPSGSGPKKTKRSKD